jgi:hypothetical protein
MIREWFGGRDIDGTPFSRFALGRFRRRATMMAARMRRIKRIYADFYHAFGDVTKQIYSHKLHKFSQIKTRTPFVKDAKTTVCVLICN